MLERFFVPDCLGCRSAEVAKPLLKFLDLIDEPLFEHLLDTGFHTAMQSGAIPTKNESLAVVGNNETFELRLPVAKGFASDFGDF